MPAPLDNYGFCAQWVQAQSQALGDRVQVLDYGCGAGQIVTALRAEGIAAFGCDLFYEGGDLSGLLEPALFDAGIIRRMEGAAIPFPSGSFDLVVSNQVMEHVADLDAVLAECCRVLRPGGAMLCVFPDRGVWREGHCGIPFLHWFPRQSRARVWYAAALRRLGLGYHTAGKTPLRWSRDFCAWLDDWTHYRSAAAIHAAFGARFHALTHIEDAWLRARLGRDLAWVRRGWQRLLARKLAGMALVARAPRRPGDG